MTSKKSLMVLVGVRSCIYSGTKVENGVVNYLSCMLEYFQFAVKNKLANVNQRKAPQRQILVNSAHFEWPRLRVHQPPSFYLDTRDGICMCTYRPVRGDRRLSHSTV